MTTKRQPSWSPHRLWYRVRQHPILAGVLALLGFGVIGVGVSMSGGKLLATWSIESAAALAVSPDGQMFAVAGGQHHQKIYKSVVMSMLLLYQSNFVA